MERKKEVLGKLCYLGVAVAARGKSTKKLLELEFKGEARVRRKWMDLAPECWRCCPVMASTCWLAWEMRGSA
jgi:hypothetical protein